MTTVGAMKIESISLIENFTGKNSDQEFYERMVELLNLGAVDRDGLLLSVMTKSNLDIVELKMFKKLLDWAYFADDMVGELRKMVRLIARRPEPNFLPQSCLIMDELAGDDGKTPEEIVNELLRYAFIVDDVQAEHLVVLLLGIGAQPNKKECLYRLLRVAGLVSEVTSKRMTC